MGKSFLLLELYLSSGNTQPGSSQPYPRTRENTVINGSRSGSVAAENLSTATATVGASAVPSEPIPPNCRGTTQQLNAVATATQVAHASLRPSGVNESVFGSHLNRGSRPPDVANVNHHQSTNPRECLISI